MRLYLQLDGPGGGAFKINQNDPKATELNLREGNLIRVHYRGVERGAWFVENVRAKPISPGEEAAALFELEGRGPLVILQEGIVYPATIPTTYPTRTFNGTRAAMLITLLSEAKARGCFPQVTWDFTATHDSHNNPWDDTTVIEVRNGQTLYDVVRLCQEFGTIFQMGSDFVLHAYKEYGHDVTDRVHFIAGANCIEVGQDTLASEMVNSLLIEGQNTTYIIANVLSAQGLYRRREGYLSATNTSDATTIQRMGEALLAEKAYPKKTVTLKALDYEGAPFRVYDDYNVGDWVVYDDGHVSTQYRVRGIAVEVDQSNVAYVYLELNSIELEAVIRLYQVLRQQEGAGMGSSLGGGVTGDPAAEAERRVREHNMTVDDGSNLHPYMIHDAVKLQGRDIAPAAPGDRNVLMWLESAQEWTPISEGQIVARPFYQDPFWDAAGDLAVGDGADHATRLPVPASPLGREALHINIGQPTKMEWREINLTTHSVWQPGGVLVGLPGTPGGALLKTPGGKGQVLTCTDIVGGAKYVEFATPARVDTDPIFDAKGDLVVGTGPDAAARLPVGNPGDIPVADPNAATGIAWKKMFVHQAVFTVEGALPSSSTGQLRIYNKMGRDVTVVKVFICVGTAPGGGGIYVDVNINGTSILSTRPHILSGQYTAESTDFVFLANVWSDGEYLTMDIDSADGGANLTVHVIYEG